MKTIALKSALCGAALLAVSAPPAQACTCPPEQSAADQAANWQLVAKVEVLSAEEIKPRRSVWYRIVNWNRPPPPPQPAQYETRMRVISVLKGSASGELVVHSFAPGMPACGINYTVGSEVTLLANAANAGGYATYMCSRPQFPDEAFEAALGGE